MRACVAGIINRNASAPTLLILTSGKIFLLRARAAPLADNLYINTRLI